MILSALAILMTASVGATTQPEAKGVAPAIGATVPAFTLKDIHRRPRSLDGYKDKKAVVVVFLDTECPLANLYVPSLVELHKEFVDKGVQFLAVYANEHDTFVQVSAHAQEREIPFPVLKDFDQQVAAAFGVKRMPEVFLLDARRVIRYHGRIDDQHGLDFRRAKPTRRDLKEALDEWLANRPITVAKTEAVGCPLERLRTPSIATEVTYAKHIAPILQKRCQECHRPGEIGPFSLLTYEDAKKRTMRIREAVLEQRMPPWHADPRFGKFVNDRRMSQQERDTLLAWIEQGTPKGDDEDLPAARTFTEGWKIGQPDAVYSMAQEFKVPASGVLNYMKFTVDPGFKEDVWVQAAEARPGNRAVVHHILVYIQQKGKPIYALDGTAATLVGWAPGDMPAIHPPGMARKIPAGAKLVFEVHYTPNGLAQTDRSSVGVIFAKKAPQYRVESNILANMLFLVPPGAANHKGQMTFTFKDDAWLLSLMPHMHLRGSHQNGESGQYHPTAPCITVIGWRYPVEILPVSENPQRSKTSRKGMATSRDDFIGPCGERSG